MKGMMPSLPGFLRLFHATAIFALAFPSLHAADFPPGAAGVDPAKTRVLLLPPIDEPAPPGRRSRVREQLVRLQQQAQFISRHFIVLGEGLATQAAQDPVVLALDSIPARSAEVLDQLAMRAGADWVVSLVIQEVAYDDDPGFNITRFKARTRLKVQVRDARTGTWLANHDHTGRASGSGPPPEIQFDSIRVAAEEALAELLAAHPQVVPISWDGAIVDYLKGQTEPFVGNPDGEPFAGLKPTSAVTPR